MIKRGKREHLHALTGLRFWLALWVVLLHLYTLSPWFHGVVDHTPWPVYRLDLGGYAAVGVFFLLSGFVLAYSYDLTERWDSAQRKRFWMARFARVYPVYCAGLLLAALWLLKVHLQGKLPVSEQQLPGIARVCAEVLLLVQAWVPPDANAWNAPSWSLSVEMSFYVLFPIVGVLLWRIVRLRSVLLALLACWATSVLLAVPLVPAYIREDNGTASWIVNFAKLHPLMRLPEFLAGILLCRLFVLTAGRRPVGSFAVGAWCTYGGLLGGLTCVLLTPSRIPTLVLHNGVMMPATCATLFGLSTYQGQLARLLSRPAMVFLGEASFALYLIHIPVYYYVAGFFKVLFVTADQKIIPLVFLPVVLCLAALLHVLLERPARKWILKHAQGDTRPEPLLSAADPM